MASNAAGICTVSLLRLTEASKLDCKIDAVLIAREIQKIDSKLTLLRCIFYDCAKQNCYWDLVVRPSLVTAFGSGRINKQQLLNSISLKEGRQSNPLSEKYKQVSYREILDDSTVAPGSLSERRLALALRLADLRAQNIDTKGFNADFLRMEDAARRNQADLQNKLQALELQLDSHVASLIASGRISKPIQHRTEALELCATAKSIQPGSRRK